MQPPHLQPLPLLRLLQEERRLVVPAAAVEVCRLRALWHSMFNPTDR